MRYMRQSALNFIPSDFQDKIKNKKITIIGCGGIGSPLANLLVRGGFLNLKLVDNDKIFKINLHRQTFFEKDCKKYKVDALAEQLKEIDEKLQIEVFREFLNQENIDKILNGSDLIVDATDNFETRRLINKYCIENKCDWIYNGAIKTEIVSCIFLGENNMFSKVFGENTKNEKCSEYGILGSTAYASASLAYNQIIKYFLNIREDNLIKIDLWTNKLFDIKLK